MRYGCVLCLLGLLNASTALAEMTGIEWEQLAGEAKGFYLRGAIDVWESINRSCKFGEKFKEFRAVSEDSCQVVDSLIEKCFKGKGLRWGEIGSEMDQYLKENPKLIHKPIGDTLFTGIARACNRTPQ